MVETINMVLRDPAISELLRKVSALRDQGRHAVGGRIVHLLDALDEEDGAPRMSMLSALALVQWLSDNPDVATPGLVVTPDGNLRASWRDATKTYLDVEFFSDDVVHIVLCNDRPNNKTARLAVSTSAGLIMDHMQPYCAHGECDWFLRGEGADHAQS